MKNPYLLLPVYLVSTCFVLSVHRQTGEIIFYEDDFHKDACALPLPRTKSFSVVVSGSSHVIEHTSTSSR